MPAFRTRGVRIAGIASAVPGESTKVVSTYIEARDFEKIIDATGVKARFIAPAGICSSDLCAAAAEHILARLGWDSKSVDLLLFVSQTPDYILPATACSLHGRLRLGKQCAAFDINLGCSGFVYGLSVAAAHLTAGAGKRALLLVGDTISKVVSPEDRSVAYLFGDAGSATAIELEGDSSMSFVTGSDGGGADYLKISAGMFRAPSTVETRSQKEHIAGSRRSDEQLYMNGAEIFNFTIREVPKMVDAALLSAGWKAADVDAFVFHQANRYMLDYLSRRMKLPAERVIIALEDFGNTSSASIPLSICHRLRIALEAGPVNALLAGFGVGFSWAAAAIEFDKPIVEDVIRI